MSTEQITLKQVAADQVPGKSPYCLALDLAIAGGFNCYSKPYGHDEFIDYETDSTAVFFFSRSPRVLEVTINLTGSLPIKEAMTTTCEQPGTLTTTED